MKQLVLMAFAALVLASCDKTNKSNHTYNVQTSSSKVEWKGSAPTHFHTGSFSVSGTVITNPADKIKSGDFVIPISSIENYDLQNPEKQQLLEHLKSPDFFNAVLHPNAVFTITKVSGYDGGDSTAIEGANYTIAGNFSMLGKVQSISFPASITVANGAVTTKAIFNIDRTKWGMNSYTDPEAGLYILPEVAIKLDIRATVEE
ncbi:MAG: YceI family protein [Agriterribacter sp.]